MAPVRYTSYAKSKAGRRTDVAMMRAADRATNAYYQRTRTVGAPRRVLPQETKYFDTAFSQTIASAADWTGTEVPATVYIASDGTTVTAYTDSALIPSAIGAGYGQVNGSKYFLKKLRVKGAVIPDRLSDQADVASAGSLRVVVVMDTQPNGAQAQGENVYTDMGNATANNFSFLAMAAGAGGRFQILKDKIYVIQPGMAATDGASTNSNVRNAIPFKFNYNFKKPFQVMLKANSSTPTVASLSNCNIFILAHTDLPSVSITGCSRAYYQD